MKDPKSYTRYEKTRIISARALQIAQGSPILVKIIKPMTPVEIAGLEWNDGIIPIDIKKRVKKETKKEDKKDQTTVKV